MTGVAAKDHSAPRDICDANERRAAPLPASEGGREGKKGKKSHGEVKERERSNTFDLVQQRLGLRNDFLGDFVSLSASLFFFLLFAFTVVTESRMHSWMPCSRVW